MGAASTVLTQHDVVYRLRLNEEINDDVAMVHYLKGYDKGKYLFTNSPSGSGVVNVTTDEGDIDIDELKTKLKTDPPYTVSPSIIQDEKALFWFIRLKFRDTRRTIADMLAFRHSNGEDVGLFNVDYHETIGSHAPPPVPTDSPYTILAECADISDLSYITSSLLNQNCIVLNLANNGVTDKDLEKAAAPFISSNIRALQLGGNRFRRLASVTPLLPVGLLVLDLSYSEGLEFTFDCLKSCFQLMRLILDGCGLTSTFVSDTKNGRQQSLFQYLYCLQELSLKENNLDSLASLGGLTELARAGTDSPLPNAVSLAAFGVQSTSASTLRSLWLADNPICDISSVFTEVVGMLQGQLTSLQYVDDKPLRSSASSSTKTFSMSMLSPHYSRQGSSGEGFDSKAFDAANAEFVAALRGEKDVSVVA
jgi:hypothetical protein